MPRVAACPIVCCLRKGRPCQVNVPTVLYLFYLSSIIRTNKSSIYLPPLLSPNVPPCRSPQIKQRRPASILNPLWSAPP
ncbi:hypothetical protein ARMSODRAFT_70797 [Armillaria solidipes]|uniref:Uncharacterized protein n=1 Tax=Armillaria solidipes TaxID=1076256 RepID=A0A2H3BKA1_9AGAR|nr:hypothetical protein ARMSODRAFT_70797 [Armillaria solidipes]